MNIFDIFRLRPPPIEQPFKNMGRHRGRKKNRGTHGWRWSKGYLRLSTGQIAREYPKSPSKRGKRILIRETRKRDNIARAAHGLPPRRS